MPRRPLRLLAPALAGSLVAVSLFLAISRERAQDPARATWEEWDDVSRAPGDGKPARTPNAWFFIERAWPRMEIPRDAWRTAQLQAQALAEVSTSRAAWQLRGPTNIGGRITDLAVDPRNANVAFAATAEGGVMRTRDGGQSWDLVFDDQAALAVGAIALDPGAPDIVYAGTGEVNPGGGSVAYGGVGVLRSSNGGDAWEPLGLEETGAIGRLVIDPTNSNRIFAAAMGHLWTPGPDRGVYRTLDGGTTWERVLYVNDTTGCVDLIMRPDNPQVVLAAMWQRIRTPERYDYGGAGCAIWRSTDGGTNWQTLGGGLPAPGTESGRIGLTLCAAQPTRIYAVYADRTGYFAGLYRSDNGGGMWVRTSDADLSDVFASYGWWFGNVRCHPVNPNTVFVLGLDFYRTTNGGSSWSEVSGGMHVDHHGLAFGAGRQSRDLQRQRRRSLSLHQRRHGLDHAARPADHPGLPPRPRRAEPRRAVPRWPGHQHGAHPHRRPRRLGDHLRRRRLPAPGPPDQQQPHLGAVPVRHGQLLVQRRLVVHLGHRRHRRQ